MKYKEFSSNILSYKKYGSYYLRAKKPNKPHIEVFSYEPGKEYSFNLIEPDGDIVGQLEIMKIDEDTFQVYYSHLDKEYMGRGYGKMMYDYAMDWAKENNVWLEPDEKITDEARRLWHKFHRAPGYKKQYKPRHQQSLSTHIDPEELKPEDTYVPWTDMDEEDIPQELKYRYRRALYNFNKFATNTLQKHK